MGTNDLPIISLDKIHERYYAGMYGDFEETVTKHIAKLRQEGTWESAEKVRFYDYLLGIVDRERYREVRNAFLSPPKINGNVLKYLDPVSWFDHKFGFAFKAQLHKKPPMRILDLGTGPGHFLVIAKFYGHEIIGNEIPDQFNADSPTPLYDALEELYGTTRIKHRIEPFTPLPELPGKFDLVTAFSAAFNLARGGIFWDKRTWDYFLANLKEDVLTEQGAFFLMLVRGKRHDDIWEYLASMAEWSRERELLLYMNASALPKSHADAGDALGAGTQASIG